MFLRITPAIAAILLTGCGTIVTTKDLRSTAGNEVHMTAAVSLPTAYRQMVKGTRECFVNSIFRIEADTASDGTQGTVTVVAAFDPLNTISLVAINLSALTDSATSLDGHYLKNRSGGKDGYAWVPLSMSQWAVGKPGICPL